jgi:hypothetical protein
VISVLFCSRAKDNPDCGLRRLLDSAVATTTPAEREQLEFLIKFDADDDQRMTDAELAAYPFAVKPFVWSRGEGRHGLHNAQEYLFTERNPTGRFCLMTADDFVFTRPGWVSDVLAVEDEFCVLGYVRPPIEAYAGRYDREDMIRSWVVSFGGWSPVVSSRLIEVCQNFGWQANVDSWLMGLSVVLYDLYGVVLWKTHAPFYERRGADDRPASCGLAPTYNRMEITNNVGPLNRYWFELVRRQARNVYLNMLHGSDPRQRPLGSAAFRVARRLREQPVRRLPARVLNKLRRTMTALFA